MKIEDFADISECLGGGVFMLLAQGKVVFVGKSSRAMLGKLANYNSQDMPKWFPRMIFDQVLIRKVHPDTIDQVYRQLLETYKPKYNEYKPITQVYQQIERRI